jgi:ribonuclease Z
MGSPRFLPRLVNDPFDDPVLFVPFRYKNRALLFDAGDISALTARDILKISHIFVTHTHMDHFIGFDRVLRVLLGRDKDLYLFGPQGFLSNMTGKLASYCWNLVENYRNRFTLHVTELHPDHALYGCFPCHKGFTAQGEIRRVPFDGTVVSDSELIVRAVHLDHGIPVLAFSLEERFHVNIIKNGLDAMGLCPGPWLTRFKTMIYDGTAPDTLIDIPSTAAGQPPLCLPFGKLQSTIARIRPGQRMAYITDAAGTPDNIQKMIALASGVDTLFVEAAFSHQHHDIAREKHHLTARQAGELARACKAGQYHLFHYSPRYTDCPELLEKEAQAAFAGQVPRH